MLFRTFQGINRENYFEKKKYFYIFDSVIDKKNVFKTLILKKDEKKIEDKIRKEKILFFQVERHLNKLYYT